jgi:outer membrane protein
MRTLRPTIIFCAVIITCFFSRLEAADSNIGAAEKRRLITISEGIQLVLKDSRLIKIASYDNDMAYQDSLLARSVLMPQLNVNASETFYKFKPTAELGGVRAPTANKYFFSYGFDVYQTLFDFGKNLNNYRASKELLQARKANTESVKRVALLEFTAAYFNVLEAEKMILVFEKEVESLNAYLSDIGHLCEQGAAVKNDLLPAKVKLSDAKQKLIVARNAREVAASRLNNILTLPLNEKIALQDIEMQPTQFPKMDDAWSSACTQRPEITFYAEQIKASALTERAKAVENFPVLFADAGYAYTQNNYQVHQGNSQLELGAKMNLYDGGAARSDLLKERALQKQLKEQKDKITEDIKLEVEDSYLGLKDAVEKMLVAKDALEQAEENVRFYRVKYNAGSATTTDVLEAITLQTVAQTNYNRDDYELKRSYAAFMYSMGIDLELIYGRMESGQNERTK